MPIVLPRKIFKAIAPAIKGHVGLRREVPVKEFVNAFNNHFGCEVTRRKGNLIKISPPAQGDGLWLWACTPFFIHKGINETLNLSDLHFLQRILFHSYGWNKNTFVVAPGSGAL